MADRRSRRRQPEPAWRCILAKYFLRLGEREIEAELEETPAGLRVNIDGTWQDVNLTRIGNTARFLLMLDDRVVEVLVGEEAQGFSLQIGGHSYEIETSRRRGARRLQQADSFVDGKWSLISPLTGVVTELRVQPGAMVEQGDILVVIEAMKMLNDLRSRVSGTVSRVHVKEKDRVETGQPLTEVSETSTVG